MSAGLPILPRMDRIRYEEAEKDLTRHYTTTACRALSEVGPRLVHLRAFFAGRTIARLGPADVTAYAEKRQSEGAANGTINRELALLGRMLRLAAENGKLTRVPVIRKLKESAPRQGFFERAQYDAVRKHLSPDLQLAVGIEYEYGWRCQSEVLALERRQIDLDAGTIRLDAGQTKNDDGRLVYLPEDIKPEIAAQIERVRALKRHDRADHPVSVPAHHQRPPVPEGRPHSGLPQGLADGVHRGRLPGDAAARLPADGRAGPRERRGRRARGHDDHGAQDPGGLRPLPHREPGGPPGRDAEARAARARRLNLR